MEQEIWRDLKYPICKNNGSVLVEVVDLTGKYKISNTGIIKGLPRYYKCGHGNKQEKFIEGGYIKYGENKKGYYIAQLGTDKKRISVAVARAVAFNFQDICGDYFEGAQVNHKDENVKNNNAENLEWCTAKYNCNYGHHGDNIAKANTGRKLSEETKQKIRESKLGEKNGMYGKHHAEGFNKGQIPWNKGKKWSDEVKKKMSESHKKLLNS